MNYECIGFIIAERFHPVLQVFSKLSNPSKLLIEYLLNL